MVEFCIALIRFALELANCNCLPLKPLGNVLTTSPQFDSPVYTAWLYPGAAVWCHETKHAVLSFSFFSLLAANSKPSLKWAYCIPALAKSMTVELNQAQRELDQEEKYSPLSFHLTNQILPSANHVSATCATLLHPILLQLFSRRPGSTHQSQPSFITSPNIMSSRQRNVFLIPLVHVAIHLLSPLSPDRKLWRRWIQDGDWPGRGVTRWRTSEPHDLRSTQVKAWKGTGHSP